MGTEAVGGNRRVVKQGITGWGKWEYGTKFVGERVTGWIVVKGESWVRWKKLTGKTARFDQEMIKTTSLQEETWNSEHSDTSKRELRRIVKSNAPRGTYIGNRINSFASEIGRKNLSVLRRKMVNNWILN